MRNARYWAALPLALLVLGCRDDGRPQETPIAAEDTMVVGPWADPALADQGMDHSSGMVVQLSPLQGSGVGGDATITEQGTQTQVMVRLTGASAGGSHPGHIHSGTCANIGGVVQALQPISTDNVGTGTMTTTVDIPSATVMNGEHIIVYHGDGGTPVTCGAIPGH
jgi:hypothetical protein